MHRNRLHIDFLDRETAKIDTLIAKQERLIELLGEKRTGLDFPCRYQGAEPRCADEGQRGGVAGGGAGALGGASK